MIHFPGAPINEGKKVASNPEKAREMRLESWRALEKLYNDGKCKSIGVSNFMKRHLEEIREANMSLPMVNQCEFHVYYNNKELLETCQQMGIQFEVILKANLSFLMKISFFFNTNDLFNLYLRFTATT